MEIDELQDEQLVIVSGAIHTGLLVSQKALLSDMCGSYMLVRKCP